MPRGNPDDLIVRWGLHVTGPPFAGGSAALVLPVTRDDGTPAVLKLTDPADPDTRHEAAALRHFDGDGAVALLNFDEASGALLLEQLQPGTPLRVHPDRNAAATTVCGLLRRMWRPPPPGHPFLVATDLARRWARELPARDEALGGPCGARVMEAVGDACERLARIDGDLVVGNRPLRRVHDLLHRYQRQR